MADREVDIVILGAGTTGLSAHSEASDHTESILMIQSGPYGTTCARTGCMPSKLLIAAADAKHQVDEAGVFGIGVSDVTVDGPAVMRRVQKFRDEFVSGVKSSVEKKPDEQRMKGFARFVDDHTLEVGDTTIRADRIVIATGSSPFIPPPLDIDSERVITTEQVFDLDHLPDRMAVVGGGVIGLELGQAFARLGVAVKLFDNGDRLGSFTDPEVAKYATEHFTERMDCVLNAEITGARDGEGDDDSGVTMEYKDGDGNRHEETFDYVLVAAGRRPNLEGLQLENTGLELDDRGTPVFDPCTMQCGESHIFIGGDVNSMRPLLHEAADEGRLAGRNAGRYPDIRAHPRRTPLQIAFTDPQMAIVGTPFEDLDQEKTAVGEVSFEDQGRSRVINQAHGIARVYGHRMTGKLLGAEMIGPAVEHLGHLLSWAIQQDMKVKDIIDLPFYHPVIEEGLRTALRDLQYELQMGPQPLADCIDCGPGI